MPWFKHEESGQVFEAEGIWETEARSRGCIEIDDPTGKPAKASEPTPEKADAKQPAPPEEKTPEPEPTPEKADAKGGKEKK